MNEKRKCQKCGLLIDSDLPTCPYCGYKQEEIIVNNNEKEEKKEETQENYKKANVFAFSRQDIYLNRNKNLVLFFVGFLGLQIISLFLSIILLTFNQYLASFSTKGLAFLNFATYFVTLGAMVLIINSNDIFNFLRPFKKKRTYLYGIAYGLILVIVSSFVSTIMSFLTSNTSVNNNESGINSITISFPILSIIVFGILGPICEEITYRVGLFSSISRKLKFVWAYIITILIFGLIHFDFTALFSDNLSSLIIEFSNLPTYLVSGLLLCYFYHKEGFGVSSIAHIFNNMLSLILTLLSSYLF